MPIFKNLRDSHGRFVGHGVASDLENALNEAISNVNPSAWKRFWTLTEQRLGMNPWEVLRTHGANIPLGQIANLGRATSPLVAAGASPNLVRATPTTAPNDPVYKILQDIDKQEHNINTHLARIVATGGGPTPPRVQSAAGLNIPSWPKPAGVPSWWQWQGPMNAGGGGSPTPGGFPPGWRWTGAGGFPPTPPGGAGGGGKGAGSGGVGGGTGGGSGGTGGGFGLGAAIGSFLPPRYRGMLGLGMEGYLGYEAVRDMLNPVGMFNRDFIHPAAEGAQRSWQFRTRMYNMAAAGGFPAEPFINRFYDRGGVGTVMPKPWMSTLGIGPEEAGANLQQFGIVPRSGDEGERNAIALTLAQRALPGFRGMDPNASIGFARTALGAGVGGGQELGRMPLMERMSVTLEDAVTRGLDRARILGSIESSIETMAKSGGPTIMLPQMLDLFDTLMKTNLPGGMTGEAARGAITGQAETLKTVGQDPMRTFTMMLEMRRHGMNLKEVLGPDITRGMNPEQAQMLSEAQDLANRGLYVPAADILAKIIPPESGRWLQIQQEIMPQMLPFKGLRKLAIERGAGVSYQTQTGLGMAPQTGAITREPGSVSSQMWDWAKAHGYTDEAASVLVGHAAQESSLRPDFWGKDLKKGYDFGLFNLNAPRGAGGPGAAETALKMEGMPAGEQVDRFLKESNINLSSRETAWCAAFANAALAHQGIQGTGSNVATSFDKWGLPVGAQDVQKGDVIVLDRGRATGETGGHVGFATGQTRISQTGDTEIEIISGNAGGQRGIGRDWVPAGEARIRRAPTVASDDDSEYAQFYRWAKSNGKDINRVDTQMEWQDLVMQKRDPWFKYSTNIPKGSEEFQRFFEKADPRYVNMDQRNAFAREAYGRMSGTTAPPIAPLFGDTDLVSPDRRAEERGTAVADMPAYGTTQRFGDLTSGLQLPPFNPSMAIASQAGYSASEQSAKLFGDNIATASETIISGFHHVGEAADTLAQKLMEIVGKIKTDAANYGGTGASSTQTSPGSTVH